MYPDTYQNKEDDQAVYWFSSPFDALNNWSAHTVEVWGKRFNTVEHAYHYAKYIDTDQEIANKILTAKSPSEASKIANTHKDKIRKDWNDDVKVRLMEELVRAKFLQNSDAKEILKKTGTRTIVENSPWDSYWGIGPDGNGENMMGQILMKVRDGK